MTNRLKALPSGRVKAHISIENAHKEKYFFSFWWYKFKNRKIKTIPVNNTNMELPNPLQI